MAITTPYCTSLNNDEAALTRHGEQRPEQGLASGQENFARDRRICVMAGRVEMDFVEVRWGQGF